MTVHTKLDLCSHFSQDSVEFLFLRFALLLNTIGDIHTTLCEKLLHIPKLLFHTIPNLCVVFNELGSTHRQFLVGQRVKIDPGCQLHKHFV